LQWKNFDKEVQVFYAYIKQLITMKSTMERCWMEGNENVEQLKIWTIPAEVHAAGPADEPVENSSMFHGFLVLPPYHMSSYARDPETSFATRTAPAAFNLYPAESQASKIQLMVYF